MPFKKYLIEFKKVKMNFINFNLKFVNTNFTINIHINIINKIYKEF